MKELQLPTVLEQLPEITQYVIVNKELTKVFYILDTLEKAQHLFNEFTDKENFRILTLKFPLGSYQHGYFDVRPIITVDGSELEVISYVSFLHKLFIYEVSFIGHANRGYIYSVPTKREPICSFPTFIVESKYAFFICLELAKLKMKEVTEKLLNT